MAKADQLSTLHVLSATQRTWTPLGRLVRAGLANGRMVMRPRDRGDHESLRNPHSTIRNFFRSSASSAKATDRFPCSRRGLGEGTEFGEGSDAARESHPLIINSR